jgi:predicted transcriptional regulator
LSSSNINFQTTVEKIDALDAITQGQRRSRDAVLNEALDIYLALQTQYLTLIKDGIRDAEEGRVVSHAAVREISKTWSSHI